MIGSGIFISPASALLHSGSVGMCIIIWAVCGIISLLGALAFAELGTVVPRSGAEYAYFIDSFGPLHKFWGNLPAFIASWIYVVVLRPAEVAVIVLTFAEYFCQPILDVLCIKDLVLGDHVKKLVAMLALGMITYINVSSVKLYVRIQNIFSSFKVVACLIVIFGGLYELAVGNTMNLSRGFEGTNFHPGSMALAFYSGLWAYDGWL
ncbi:Amino acid permease, partial [Oryctes borbonicus]